MKFKNSLINSFLFLVFLCGIQLGWAKDENQKNSPESISSSSIHKIQSARTAFETQNLLNRHLIYRYVEKTSPIEDNKKWEISVSESDGNYYYIKLSTTRSPVNCFNKGYPISTLELTPEKPVNSQLLASNKRKIKVSIFCGGDNGHHQTIFLIYPFSMKINTLDIGNTPINLINHNKKWYIYTLQEYYDKNAHLRVPYFLIRKLGISDANFNFDTAIANDAFSQKKYLELVKKIPKNQIEQYQNIIYLGFGKSRTKFCELSHDIKDKNLQNLLIFFNFSPCK